MINFHGYLDRYGRCHLLPIVCILRSSKMIELFSCRFGLLRDWTEVSCHDNLITLVFDESLRSLSYCSLCCLSTYLLGTPNTLGTESNSANL